MSNNTPALLEPQQPAAATESAAPIRVDGHRSTFPVTNADGHAEDLRPSLFGAFAELVEFLSPASVIETTELECDMLERDLDNGQSDPRDQALSVISFCRFIRSIRRKSPVPSPFFPAITPEQLAFYRKTVFRLRQAGELPASALLEFDLIFGSAPEPASANLPSTETPAQEVEGGSSSIDDCATTITA